MIFYVFFSACIVNLKPPTSYPWSDRIAPSRCCQPVTSRHLLVSQRRKVRQTKEHRAKAINPVTWQLGWLRHICFTYLFDISMIQPVGTLSLIRAMATMATMAWSVAVLWHTWPWPVARCRGMARPPRSPRCWSSKGAGWHRDSAGGYPNLR